MTQSSNSSVRTTKTQLVIFPHDGISDTELERLAVRVIPPESKRKLGKSESRNRSYFAGRAALSWISASYKTEFYVAPNKEFGFLELYSAPHRKIPDLFANLSHTESLVVAVLAHSPVGVDVESKERSAEQVLPRVCVQSEMAWVTEEPVLNGTDIPTGIFLWSAKEAFSKAFGLGLKFGLQGFEIHKSGSQAVFKGISALRGPLQVPAPRIVHETFSKYLITICIDEKAVLAGVDRRILSRADLELVR